MHESTGVLASFDVLYPLRSKKKDILFSRIISKRLFTESQSFSKLGSNRDWLRSFRRVACFFHAIDARRLSRVLCSNNLAGHALRCDRSQRHRDFFFLFSSLLSSSSPPDITSTLSGVTSPYSFSLSLSPFFYPHLLVLNRSLTEISFQMHPYSRS